MLPSDSCGSPMNPVPRMAKTFDNISEASATNYLFLFAQRTLALQNEPPTPPPLNALGLPCHAIRVMLKAVGLGKGPGKVAPRHRLRPEEAVVGVAAEAEAEAEAAKKITEYILDHQDDAAQEDRWRTTMKREMAKSFREQRDAIGRLDSRFDVQRKAIDEMHKIIVKDLAKEEPISAGVTNGRP
jgi:hypothetical protein